MIKQFNLVRFILVLMIFLHHEGVYEGGGCLSVSAFFILGGICMALGYGSQVLSENFSFSKYMKRRVAKLFPLHWLCLLAVLIPMWYYGWSWNNHALLANFLLLQSWIPIEDFYFSFNAVSWYLSDTLFVSLVFPFLYVFLSKIDHKDRLFLIVLLIGLYVLMMFALPSSYQVRHALLYIHPMSRLIDFSIGVFIADLYRELKGKKETELFVVNHGALVDVVVVLSLFLSVGISVLLPKNLYAIYYWPTLSCFFLGVMLMGDTKVDKFSRHGITQALTRCTFSFFLVHQIVIGQIKWVNEDMLGMEKWAEIVVAFIASYLLAQVLYFLIEKKLTQWLLQKL